MKLHPALGPSETFCHRCRCVIPESSVPTTGDFKGKPTCLQCETNPDRFNAPALTFEDDVEEADDMFWGWPPQIKSDSLSLSASGEKSSPVQPEGEGGVDG